VPALRLTWLGHATVLVELDGVRIITDPLLRRRAGLLRRSAELDAAAPAGLDAVAISHAHHDHLDRPSLRRLDRAAALIVPRGAGRYVAQLGFAHVNEVVPGDSIHLGDVIVSATRAEHDGRRFPSREPARSVGYLFAGSLSVYFAGDTDLFAEMEEVSAEIDVALLPISGWGPRVPAGHLDPDRAAEAAQRLRPRIAIPIHWGTFRPVGLPLDAEARRAPAAAFERRLRELAPGVSACVLEPGGSVELAAPASGTPEEPDVRSPRSDDAGGVGARDPRSDGG
jgi:L-ascorbate metabolism protein UlaG (beta-lactamase superfamily)